MFGSNNGSGKLYFWVFRNRDIAPIAILSQLEPRHFLISCRAFLGEPDSPLPGSLHGIYLLFVVPVHPDRIVDEWFVFSA